MKYPNQHPSTTNSRIGRGYPASEAAVVTPAQRRWRTASRFAKKAGVDLLGYSVIFFAAIGLMVVLEWFYA